MKKMLCILLFMLSICTFLSLTVSAADELSKVTMEDILLDGDTITADLVVEENSGLTGYQCAISFNGALMYAPQVELVRGFFDDYRTSQNGNIQILSFTTEKSRKVQESGVFAKLTFQVQPGVTLNEDDVSIYLLPREAVTTDFTPEPENPEQPENPVDPDPSNPGTPSSGGSSGGGAAAGGNDKIPDQGLISYPSADQSGTWVKGEDNTWTFLHNGAAVKDWQKVDGKWYYFIPESGVMKTGWAKVDGKWYWLESSGAMKTGWAKVDGKWYWLESSGAMKTGWAKIDGKWYWLESSGAMKTGWVKVDGKWYWLESSGAMKTGWVKVDGKWYYLDNSGAMLANTTTPDGYQVDGSGAWIV